MFLVWRRNSQTLVLFGWPAVVFYLFKRFQLTEALCYSVIFGYLLVPQLVGFDLPLVPPYDKELVVNVSAAVMCIVMARAALRRPIGSIGGSLSIATDGR